MFETKEETRGMVVTITIPLPECQQDYDTINQANRMYSALCEIKDALRQWEKYDVLPKLEGKEVETPQEALAAAADRIREIVEENKVDLDI